MQCPESCSTSGGFICQSPSASLALNQGHCSSLEHLSLSLVLPLDHPLSGTYWIPPWSLLWSLPAGGPPYRKRPQPECRAFYCLTRLQLCPQGHHKPVQQPSWPLLLWKHLQLQQRLGVKDSSQWAGDKRQSVSRPMQSALGRSRERLTTPGQACAGSVEKGQPLAQRKMSTLALSLFFNFFGCMWNLSSPIKGQTLTLYSGRDCLNHLTAGEVPSTVVSIFIFLISENGVIPPAYIVGLLWNKK